jgi:hypothetical protein
MVGRPPSPSFPFFPFYYLPFYLNHRILGQIGVLLTTWVGRLTTYLGWLATPYLPYKRSAKGSLLLSHKLTNNLKFPEPFSKFLARFSEYKSLNV